jgi:hypothetical protein
MSRKTQTSQARDRARQAAARLKPAADRVKPLADSAAATATRSAHRTRAWAAPQLERTGQVLQHSAAPKVSAWLSLAAQRLDPGVPRRARWRTPVGLATVTAAAGAAAAYLRRRTKGDSATATAEPGEQAPAGGTRDGQATARADADIDGQVRSS